MLFLLKEAFNATTPTTCTSRPLIWWALLQMGHELKKKSPWHGSPDHTMHVRKCKGPRKKWREILHIQQEGGNRKKTENQQSQVPPAHHVGPTATAFMWHCEWSDWCVCFSIIIIIFYYCMLFLRFELVLSSLNSEGSKWIGERGIVDSDHQIKYKLFFLGTLKL